IARQSLAGSAFAGKAWERGPLRTDGTMKRLFTSQVPGYDEKMFHPHGPTFWELARQALSSTERGYDLLAAKFDYTPFRTPDCLLEGAARLIAPLGPFERAIDLGCGTGAGLMAIRPFCRRMVGIDFSQGMLTVCRDKVRGFSGVPPTNLVRGQLL